MNYGIVVYILGWIMNFEAAFMTMPCLVAAIKGERQGLAFLWVMLACVVVGGLTVRHKPKNMTFYVKEGFVTVALSWIVMSVIGCLPFVINEDIPNFIDALFETISGFTTTGASILSNIEGLSRCSLFWRSFTHWIGGMGVLVFILAILPLTGGSNMNLMKAESPGPSVGKLVPKVRQTAIYLYGIYIVLTIIEVIFLLCGKMKFFEAVTTAMSTAGTGGFAIRNDSLMSASPYIQWVVTIFMILFGVNFSVYFLILMKKFGMAVRHEEARAYLLIMLSSIIIIFINVRDMWESAADAIRHVSFQVASVMTTTGFCTADFDLWPQTSQTILILIMFIGACAGSTGGGIKVSRIIILVKTVGKEIVSYIHPRSVKKVKVEGKVVEHDVLRATNVYFITFVILFALSVFLLSFDGKSLVTNFTAVVASINNIGPGLEAVGPTQNFAGFSVFSKLVLMFDMLAGRLELFPLLLLFSPSLWIKGKNA
ncbi:MAG: TrkH family potassium uptake protein [Clostridium sp.]|nr:TrkH family potassium uptake protein [Clostridium sp.]MCM1399066.1 TrkH family potassium uptake protein [Clostridium sp.]MCM1459457.1 TrkH family potassium uptake protein [Bacteroides sp.]